MVRFVLVLLMIASPAASAELYSEKERRDTQLKLDLKCEQARDRKLYPMRLKIFEECMAKRDSEAHCDAYAGSYNGERVNGAPRYYDLPECETAFEFRKTHRIRR